MLKVGLTGGIGCGKSTATNAFRRFGIRIIDADQISKDLVEPNQPALNEIAKVFGTDYLNENGSLNRDKLKKTVFSDAEALDKLEAIIHPLVRQEINKQLTKYQAEPYVIVDVPLLVEKNYQAMFDRIIVVDCSEAQQIERVLTRDEMTESDVKKIMKTQVSREQRLSIATDRLDNSGSIEHLDSQIKALHLLFVGLSAD